MRFSASKIDFSVLSIDAEMDASISFIFAISTSVIVIACRPPEPFGAEAGGVAGSGGGGGRASGAICTRG